MAAEKNGILRSYLGRLQPATPAQQVIPPPAPDIGHAAALAAGRAGKAVAGLALHSEAAIASNCSLAELMELLPEQPLLAMIEADRDRLGVLALSPGVLLSLIEMQAFGRVTDNMPDTRKPTRADATLASDFINALLAGLSAEAMRIPGEEAIVGFRYASHLDDPQPLGLMLEDGGFRSVRLDLLLGQNAQRRGAIFLAVPLNAGEGRGWKPPAVIGGDADARRLAVSFQAGEGIVEATADAPAETPRHDDDHLAPAGSVRRNSGPATLAGAVRHAPVPLVAVLCRRRISLSELRGLGPGKMLALPRHALEQARVETRYGNLLATGKLGEAEGFHALRLHPHDQASAVGRTAQTQALRDPLAPDPPPIDDLEQPDDFRPPASDGSDAVQNWQQALTDGPIGA